MKPARVLFLCTGNSARSIIGAALLRQMGGDSFEVVSAGTHPKGINPYTIQILREVGIDASNERSKDVAEFVAQSFDYVITVCDDAERECPAFPGGGARIHWSFPDPAAATGTDAEKLDAFRDTLRTMASRVSLFLARREGAG